MDGGIGRETKETFLVEVPVRSSINLMPEIHTNVKEGIIIYYDYWRTYNTMKK